MVSSVAWAKVVLLQHLVTKHHTKPQAKIRYHRVMEPIIHQLAKPMATAGFIKVHF